MLSEEFCLEQFQKHFTCNKFRRPCTVENEMVVFTTHQRPRVRKKPSDTKSRNENSLLLRLDLMMTVGLKNTLM